MGENRLSKRATSRLTALFEKPDCPIQYLDLGGIRPLLKGEEEQEPAGTRFQVIFSRAGVEIREAARKSGFGDVTWMQDDSVVEITFKKAFLRCGETSSLNVSILPKRLQIQVKAGTVVFEADLFAPVKPDESKWTVSDGLVKVTLHKVEKTDWPGLFMSAGL